MATEPVLDPRVRLRADCSRCAALCCIALPFHRSSEFAFDKAGGQPCRNLADDFRCRVHAELRPLGMAGCTTFDCLGAGQHVTQVGFGGRTWREDPSIAATMFGAFATVRRLHELLWYLADAVDREATAPLHGELREASVDVERLAARPPADLVEVDQETAARGRASDALLRQASVLVRAGHPTAPRRAGADLVGARLRGADLRGADLSGALLLGADLQGADLRLADLRYADLRGADLRGADLSDSLYVIGPQLAAARGDDRTALPSTIARPPHWS
ncbi:pentapeptide repeat-containing protein [Cellulomonas soli]|uniref:pentapeptide repeat-containing protein n=1 Tax=Cellulomonas soli TaxID=931535 RepID=UPI003F852037